MSTSTLSSFVSSSELAKRFMWNLSSEIFPASNEASSLSEECVSM